MPATAAANSGPPHYRVPETLVYNRPHKIHAALNHTRSIAISLKVLVADSERTWLKACNWWLTAAGYEVATATSPSALRYALAADTYGLRLLDAKLCHAANDRQALPALHNAIPGCVWLESPPRPLKFRSGRGTALYCPRPRSRASLETLLQYLLHPDTARLLDASLVGEILGMLPTPTGAASVIANFTDETLALVKVMTDNGPGPAAQAAQHALQGCAAAIGAVALQEIVANFEVPPRAQGPSSAGAQLLVAIIAATEHSLQRAVRAYFADS